MANITTIPIVSTVGATGNFDASAVWSAGSSGGNFNRVSYQVNGQLDSNNFGVSSFLSQHFNTQVINSMHVTNNAIVADKITDGAIQERHIEWRSASDGVRLLRIGKAGYGMARMSASITYSVQTNGTANYISYPVVFSASTAGSYASGGKISCSYKVVPQDGSPGFTASAYPLAAGATHVNVIGGFALGYISSINSASCAMRYNVTNAGALGGTWYEHLMFIGR